jgi:hypothetical protein
VSPGVGFGCCGEQNLLSVTITGYLGTKLVFSTTTLCPRKRLDCSNTKITNLNPDWIVNIRPSSSLLTCNLRPRDNSIRYPRRLRVRLNKGFKSCYSKGGNNLNHTLSSRRGINCNFSLTQLIYCSELHFGR